MRGTSRTQNGIDAIAAAGIAPALADPDRAGTVLELVGDVAVVVWALGSASGPESAAVNGPRLERVLERLVDTPVRGFVYEAAGSAPAEELAAGAELVREAEARWRIPAAVVEVEPTVPEAWVRAMTAAANGVLAR